MLELEECTCHDDLENENTNQKHENDKEHEIVSHMQPVSKCTELDEIGNIITRKSYGLVYVPFKWQICLEKII